VEIGDCTIRLGEDSEMEFKMEAVTQTVWVTSDYAFSDFITMCRKDLTEAQKVNLVFKLGLKKEKDRLAKRPNPSLPSCSEVRFRKDKIGRF
jgi:hypothetical protein